MQVNKTGDCGCALASKKWKGGVLDFGFGVESPRNKTWTPPVQVEKSIMSQHVLRKWATLTILSLKLPETAGSSRVCYRYQHREKLESVSSNTEKSDDDG